MRTNDLVTFLCDLFCAQYNKREISPQLGGKNNFHYHKLDDCGSQVEFNSLMIDDRQFEGKLLKKWVRFGCCDLRGSFPMILWMLAFVVLSPIDGVGWCRDRNSGYLQPLWLHSLITWFTRWCRNTLLPSKLTNPSECHVCFCGLACGVHQVRTAGSPLEFFKLLEA